ncbi:MAG: hypothetical protein OIN88_04845 [Candidatus Methanoperedens sp.]|nr:hypothetical protein [Candidatus Methanoperedens sp.]
MNERLALVGSCLAVSVTVTLFFYFLALGQGYSQMDIIIGSIWTFVLATIISSPIIIPVIRNRLKRAEN